MQETTAACAARGRNRTKFRRFTVNWNTATLPCSLSWICLLRLHGGRGMPIKHTRMCQSILFLGIVGFTFAISGRAHASTVNFQIAFSGHVDCHRPFNISHVPISGSGTGSLNSDGSATADITETAFVLSSRNSFRGPAWAIDTGSRRLGASARRGATSAVADLESAQQSNGDRYRGQRAILHRKIRVVLKARQNRVHVIRWHDLSLLRPADRRNRVMPSAIKSAMTAVHSQY